MWPDLGKYAFAVNASYGIAILLLGLLVVLSLRRARKAKTALDAVEQQAKRNG